MAAINTNNASAVVQSVAGQLLGGGDQPLPPELASVIAMAVAIGIAAFFWALLVAVVRRVWNALRFFVAVSICVVFLESIRNGVVRAWTSSRALALADWCWLSVTGRPLGVTAAVTIAFEWFSGWTPQITMPP